MYNAGISKIYQTWVYSILRLAKKSYHIPAGLITSPGKNNLNTVIEKDEFCTKAALKIGRN